MRLVGQFALVEPCQPLLNGLVELIQAEETLFAERGQHPALDLLHSVFTQGFVFRFGHSGRDHGDP